MQGVELYDVLTDMVNVPLDGIYVLLKAVEGPRSSHVYLDIASSCL